MLGDEIMPLSNMDNFGNHDNENEDDTVQKRGRIMRVLKGKTGTKRIWVKFYFFFIKLNKLLIVQRGNF